MAHLESTDRQVLIVTGMSGAGRSTAANALEDQGWYVVDNLPPQMLKPLIDLGAEPAGGMAKLACVVDARGGQFFEQVQQEVLELAKRENITVLFLDSTDDVLVRRFEQVRRPHPLQGDGTILDGISRERVILSPIRERSDVVVDTSDLTVHQLTKTVSERFAESAAPGLNLTIMSFGFKYGLPTDVDMVWDMRFLPNPYWNTELKELRGTDPLVLDFVTGSPLLEKFLRFQLDALAVVLDGYGEENKRFATLAVGCTGGKHRSVATVEHLAATLAHWPQVRLSIKHRDVGRE